MRRPPSIPEQAGVKKHDGVALPIGRQSVAQQFNWEVGFQNLNNRHEFDSSEAVQGDVQPPNLWDWAKNWQIYYSRVFQKRTWRFVLKDNGYSRHKIRQPCWNYETAIRIVPQNCVIVWGESSWSQNGNILENPWTWEFTENKNYRAKSRCDHQ
jgi:hypothetical protein